MSEQSQQEDERENLSGMDDCEAYMAYQNDMPENKRDGYTERINEIAEYNEER